jgi:hypothetical protein
MESDEIEARAKHAQRLAWYKEKAPFGWFECLRQIKDMLTDPVWEGDELAKACRKYFMMEEAHLRVLVGLAARPVDLRTFVTVDLGAAKAQKEVDQILDSETGEDLGASTWPGKKALTPAEKQRAYRERKKGEK